MLIECTLSGEEPELGSGERGLSMNLLPIRWLEAENISSAVLFLASDESRYITGVTLPVDAGALVK